MVRLPSFVKYLRSEVGASIFGEKYDRNAVIIRERASDSFVDLCAKGVVHAVAKTAVNLGDQAGSLRNFLSHEETRGVMPLLCIKPDEFPALKNELDALLSDPVADFDGGIYIRVGGVLSKEGKEDLLSLVEKHHSHAQILLEEQYDPLMTGASGMRKVTFIHDQTDRTSYQLLQDSASTGMRVSLDDVLLYFFEAGKLSDLLNTERKTEDTLPPRLGEECIAKEGEDRDERDSDYAVLLNTARHCRTVADRCKPATPIERKAKELTLEDLTEIQSALESVLTKAEPTVRETAQVFHRCYYKLRTAVQYTAQLADRCLHEPIIELESRIADRDGALVVATNSGMTASRTVITSLYETVSGGYSGRHYWEQDALEENLGPNPHYKNVREQPRAKLERLEAELPDEEIDRKIDLLLEGNAASTGQLVSVDQSIAPFFYTKTLNVRRITARLAENESRIVKPIYLVIDNTLDFHEIRSKLLFPAGIPKNVFLIFVPSQAKLNQAAFDFTTGGEIRIHFHPAQALEGERLAQLFRSRVDAEGSRQSTYALQLLDLAFHQHFRNGTLDDYVNFMIRKRHRNTKALVQRIAGALGAATTETSPGLFEYGPGRNTSHADAQSILVPDPDVSGRTHEVRFSFHFEPKSCIHAYLKILEPETDKYIAGRIFEEIKRRTFQMAAAEGIHLSDGTSWGFTITRLDWYMHTLRIAVGLEHRKTLDRLGTIMGSVLKDFLFYPKDFLLHRGYTAR